MMMLRTVAPWLLLAFLGLQVFPSSGERGRDRGAHKSTTPAPGRAQRSKPAAHGRGKFNIDADDMQCTWASSDVADTVRLSVKCENPVARIEGGTTDMQCDYNGKPQRCPGYQSDPRGFWKQVARAFKRLQGKTCLEERALVRAGMCKSAPRDAHFKLDVFSSVASGQSGGLDIPPSISNGTISISNNTTACEDARARGEDYCGSSWASLCTLFFSMMQKNDC